MEIAQRQEQDARPDSIHALAEMFSVVTEHLSDDIAFTDVLSDGTAYIESIDAELARLEGLDFPFCPKDTEQVTRLCKSTERYERQRRNLTHTHTKRC